MHSEQDHASEGLGAHDAPDPRLTPHVVATILGLYAYNRGPWEWVEAVFPESRCHADYIDEKRAIAARGFFNFFGVLDIRNQQKLIAAAMDAYEQEALDRLA